MITFIRAKFLNVLREDGSVMAEALIAIPFLTIFAAGILEFGNIFWQRMQIQNGLRDAVRFVSRCGATSTFTMYCATYNSDGTLEDAVPGESVAKTLAFYGTTSTNAPPRVPGWGPDPSDITIVKTVDPNSPDPTRPDYIVTASTNHAYAVHLLGWLGLDTIHIKSYQQEHFNEW